MSDVQTPFRPTGPTFAILASNLVTPPGTLINLVGDWALMVYNRSTTQDAYLSYGPTSAAVNGSIIPLVSNPPVQTQNVLPLPHGSVQVFTFSGPTFIGANCAAGNTTIDITTGTGA